MYTYTLLEFETKCPVQDGQYICIDSIRMENVFSTSIFDLYYSINKGLVIGYTTHVPDYANEDMRAYSGPLEGDTNASCP
jgi:hypothetical protein